MSAPIQQKLVDISGLTSKLLRKNFGRGPDSCNAFVHHRYLVFYIRGFLSPMEGILLANGSVDHINFSRNIVMNAVLSNLQGILEMEFKQDIADFYHDWNYDRNTGMITVVFEREISPCMETLDHFPEHDPLIAEVERLSALVQKKPERTEAYRVSPKLYLVKRTGILIPLEKALISKGFQQVLLDTMNDLEKSSFNPNGGLKDIFKQPIADIFVGRNLIQDNSITCFVLK